MAATGGGSQRRDDEVALRDLLLLVYRRRFLLILCMMLGGLVGIAVLALVQPIYVARSFILLEPGRDGGGSTVASASETLDSASVDSQVRILASRALAREVLAALGPGEPPPPSAVQRLAQLLPPALAAPTAIDEERRPPDPVDGFLAGLLVKREGKSHVIEIAYRSSEPERAAAVANKLAERYMLAQRLRKEEAARRRTGWYDERLAALKGQLGRAEQALAKQREAAEANAEEALGAGADELAGLNIQLVTAAVDRSAREASLARVRRAVESGEGADAIAQFGATPLLANLSALKAEVLRREAELTAQYGERHPKILDVRAERAKLDSRLQQERRAALRQLEGDLDQARAKEATLAAKLAELKGTALRREVSAAHLRDLQHEVELNRRLLDGHLAKANDADRPRAEPEPDARVLSEAIPPKDPSFPDPRLILSLSLSGGFLFGLAALYVAQSGERGFRAPREIEASLGLPTLALVPRLDARKVGGAPPEDYVVERPRSRCAESLRALLAGLLRPRGDGRPAPRVVLVTSSLPREGKSTLTLSLARVAAGEGMRVIVIDADLRKPRLHELVGLADRAGLVEVLRREVTLAEAVVKDPKAPLHLLPGSRRLAQPTRILGPNGLGTLFNALRGSFDLVLVDSAPLAAVADAKLLGGLVDTVLFVVRYGDTRRDFCRSCLLGLRESGADIAGVVLTQVDLRQHRRLFAQEAGPSGKRVADYYAD